MKYTTIKSIANETLETSVRAYYNDKLEEVPKNWKWSDIIFFDNIDSPQLGDKNRINISDSNHSAFKSDLIVTEENNYPTTYESFLFTQDILNSDKKIILSKVKDIKIAREIDLFIPVPLNESYLQLKKDRLHKEFLTKIYRDVNSGLFSDYIAKIYKDNQFRPYYSDSQLINGILKNTINISNISHRIYIVSKAMDYKVINVSPFLINGTFNDDMNGSNFSFTIASPTATYKDGWKPDNTQIRINDFNELEITHQDAINAYRVINSMQNSEPVYTFKNLYFDVILQKFDIVFIRGERMFNEESETKIDNKDVFEIRDLVGKYWDLIGFIDKTEKNYQIANGMIGFNVQGRDLMALTIETQNMILPAVQIKGTFNPTQKFLSNYIANFGEASKSHSIDRIFGQTNDLNNVIKTQLGERIDWVFDHMQHCPFTNDINKFSEFKDDNPYKSFEELNWKELGLLKPYQRLGIWNLVAVWIDNSVRDRFISDATFINTSGNNMLAYIKKIAQTPLVEFFTLNIGSYHHWIVRKPPFSQKDYIALFNACNVNNSHTITSEQVLSVSLEWDSQDIYSIFRFVPMATLWSPIEIQWMFPAICISELMDRFDAKLWEVPSNYCDTGHLEQSFEQNNHDLQWLLETTLFKQFSQKGSITIIGNRIIKKGTAIYLESLDLLCYVTGVSNQFSINDTSVNRITVIQVERCIRLAYYDLYFSLVDFSSLKDRTNGNNKFEIGLTKDNEGKPYVYEFFEKRLDQDYDNLHTEIKDKLEGIFTPDATINTAPDFTKGRLMDAVNSGHIFL